jgi:hypothetical protein
LQGNIPGGEGDLYGEQLILAGLDQDEARVKQAGPEC